MQKKNSEWNNQQASLSPQLNAANVTKSPRVVVNSPRKMNKEN